MKVLIVDDSESMRRLIKSFIADIASDTIECGDGREALAAYRSHRPDIVVMDVKMDGMDGLAATGQIKQEFPEARIVMVSQWEDRALREAARAVGAEAYVGKADLLPLRRLLADG
jgi:CheY-like chemotaxis protein